jgi:hypothetical protein
VDSESSEQSPIAYGYCHCGCGRKTNLAKYTSHTIGHIKDEPVRYIRGHAGAMASRREPSLGERLCRCHNEPMYQNGSRRWLCPKTSRERVKRYYYAQREADPRYNLRVRVRREYGLTLDEYDTLLAGGCTICGAEAVGIDHCHATGLVRGALCRGCNVGLGQFGEDSERLRLAADYLEVHKRVLPLGSRTS